MSYETLVRQFFEQHDPTQGMQQGSDVGTQYRSALFCTSDAQAATAEALRAVARRRYAAAGFGAVTTPTIEPAASRPFYWAESCHQRVPDQEPRRLLPDPRHRRGLQLNDGDAPGSLRGSGPSMAGMRWLGRALFWVLFAGRGVLVAWRATHLPARVPAHLGADGAVDRWGSLSEHLALAGGLGVLMLLLGPGSAALLRVLPRSAVNLPHPSTGRPTRTGPRRSSGRRPAWTGSPRPWPPSCWRRWRRSATRRWGVRGRRGCSRCCWPPSCSPRWRSAWACCGASRSPGRARSRPSPRGRPPVTRAGPGRRTRTTAARVRPWSGPRRSRGPGTP